MPYLFPSDWLILLFLHLMNTRLLLLWLITISWPLGLLAQQQADTTARPTDTLKPPKVKTWQINEMGEKQRLPMDTSLYDSHDINPALGQINLGQLGGPMKHHLYHQRAKSEFLFLTPYHPLLQTRESTRYIKTRYPFTFLKYNTGEEKDGEARLRARHSQNVNEKLNVGVDANLLASKKFYENDRTLKSHFIELFGSYETVPYSVFANVNINKVELKEQGGIQDRQDFEGDLKRVIPGRLDNAKNVLKNSSLHVVHTLSLKKTSLSKLNIFERIDEQTLPPDQKDSLRQQMPPMPRDSVAKDSLPAGHQPADSLYQGSQARDSLGRDSLYREQRSVHTSRQAAIPPDSVRQDTARAKDRVGQEEKKTDTGSQADQTRFYAYHHLSLSANNKKYNDGNPQSDFYSRFPILIDSTRTRDRAQQTSFRNEFKLVYANRFAELSTGIDNNLVGYSYVSPDQGEVPDYDHLKKRNYNNLSLNASLSLFQDTAFSFDARGRYYLSGFKGGDLYLDGSISKSIGKNMLTIEGSYQRYEPDYFYQHYHSNHFHWDKRLAKIREIQAAGHFRLSSWRTTFTFRPSLIRNYTYLDTSATPAQNERELELLTASLQKDFTLWKFHSTNKLVVQYTGQDDVLSLPLYYFYHRFAFRHTFHFEITGGKLDTQVGWSLYYTPSYQTDDYMPALGMFYRQDEQSIGDTPLFNLFANIQIKRTRLFVKLYHLSSYIQTRDYYTAPRYPMSPMMLKFGVSWSFYD